MKWQRFLTVVLTSQKQTSSGGTIDFGHLSYAVVQQAVAIGESFSQSVTLTKAKLRKITDQKSSEYKHSLFQQQSTGIGNSEKLAIIAMKAAKTLLKEMGISKFSWI